MSDDDDPDVCGAETTGDGTCQNPAGENGRCWIPSHNDPNAENANGRPSKFTDERARQAIDAAEQGKSIKGCGRDAGVAGETIATWRDDDDLTFTDSDGETRHFSVAFRRARGSGETKWMHAGEAVDDVNGRSSSFAKFMLASSYDYKKTEKTELTGEDGGPIEHDVPAEFVTYQADDGDE